VSSCSSFFRGVTLAVVIALPAGCDRGTAPPTSVHGKVSYHAWPVAGARVIFVPDVQTAGNGPLAQAETDTDGRFVLRCENATDIAPGRYRITVMALESPPAALPDKYRDPELSGLATEVQAGADNVVDLNLE
jgi:hypothetical protein